jgi:hypothetical protein
VREFDWVSDSYSKVATKMGLTWPKNDYFCGKREYKFEVLSFSRATA